MSTLPRWVARNVALTGRPVGYPPEDEVRSRAGPLEVGGTYSAPSETSIESPTAITMVRPASASVSVRAPVTVGEGRGLDEPAGVTVVAGLAVAVPPGSIVEGEGEGEGCPAGLVVGVPHAAATIMDAHSTPRLSLMSTR